MVCAALCKSSRGEEGEGEEEEEEEGEVVLAKIKKQYRVWNDKSSISSPSPENAKYIAKWNLNHKASAITVLLLQFSGIISWIPWIIWDCVLIWGMTCMEESVNGFDASSTVIYIYTHTYEPLKCER